MAKAEEKKVVKPVVEKVVAEKEKPAVVVATVKEEKKLPAPKEDSPFGFTKKPNTEQSEEVKLQIAALGKQDIENIPDIALNNWRFSSNKSDRTESKLTIDGKVIEPIIKGVVGDSELFGVNFFGSFDFGRRSEIAFKEGVRNAIHTWDVYVYKVKIGRHFRDASNLLTPLEKKVDDNSLYQILVLSEGSSMELDADISVSSYPDVGTHLKGQRYGTLLAVESHLKNVVAIGKSLLHKQAWEDVIAKETIALSTEYNTGVFKRGTVTDSILIDTSVYGEGNKYGSGNLITDSKFNGVTFHNSVVVVRKSKLRDSMFNGKWTRIVKSKLSGFSLNADKDITVENTVMYNEYRLHLSAKGDIKLQSIYDIAMMPVAVGINIVLFGGDDCYWLNVIDDRNDMGTVVHKVAANTRPPRGDLMRHRYGGPMPFQMREENMEHLDTIVRRAVRDALGDSAVSEKIAEHISSTFNDRIGIARTIHAANKITKVQVGYSDF